MTLPPDKLPSGEPPGLEPEPFLSRWSRLKREAREPAMEAQPAPPPGQKADTPPPELPPLDELTPESDYRGFLHPKVDENLRRAALKKLFTDPHFNVMDGLDIYIDDYSKSDPLPAALLAQLRQAQSILDWAREQNDGAAPPAVVTGEEKCIESVSPAGVPAPSTDEQAPVERLPGSQTLPPSGEPADR